MTLGNALSRFAEFEAIQRRAGKGRDRHVTPGPRAAGLAALAERIGAGLIGV